MMKLLKTLGSLTLAITLLTALVVTLILSTSLESAYGTPFVQRFFYSAEWFDGLLALFFLNIAAATLTRWPFKRTHTGFVTTHIGILMVLAGSLLTRLLAVDGQMALAEGETLDRITQQSYQLVAHRHGPSEGATQSVELGPKTRGAQIKLSGSDYRLLIDRVLEQGVQTVSVSEGSAEAPANPAANLTLSSETAGLSETFWLIADDPSDPSASSMNLGPATVELKTRKPPPKRVGPAPAVPTVTVTQRAGGKSVSIELTKIPSVELPLSDTGLKIAAVRYYPDARVEGGKLVSVSDEPNNPAVELEVRDAAGAVEHHTRFLLFPDFESLHGKDRADRFGLDVTLDGPQAPHAHTGSSARLTVYGENGKWSYAASARGGETSGDLQRGKSYPAGWMDFTLKVNELYERAAATHTIRPAGPEEQGPVAAQLRLFRGNDELFSAWVTPNLPFQYDTDGGPIIALIEQKGLPAPFTLTLDDFRKVDYPGTRTAASYESDVTMTDPKEKFTIKKTISMNKPLDYKGYRIFQSSYVQNPSGPEISIFTVAKNPGITLIYCGSVILFLGVALIFYVKPLSSFSQLGNGGKKK